MRLRLEDFRSGTWGRFISDANERLDELRKRNDSTGLTESQTAAIRGSIAEVKRILALHENVSASNGSAPEPLVDGSALQAHIESLN